MLVDRLITNLRIPNSDELGSVAILNERFVALPKNQSLSAKWTLDAEGALILPGLIQPHTHIDKSYSLNLAGAKSAGADSLSEAIAQMRELKGLRTLEDIRRAMRKALIEAISSGCCAMVTHIDLGNEADLEIIEMALSLKKDFAELIDLRITPLGGLLDQKDIALVKRAIAMGCNAVGGCPALEKDPHQAVLNAIEIAEHFDCAVDLHIDETEDANSRALESLADAVLQRAFKNRVMASHCCSLAFMQKEDQKRIIEKVALAGIHIVTLPACNAVLMGKDMSPAPRGNTPVRQLLEAGVNVCAGSDNVQDPFQPWGCYDPLYTAGFNAQISQLQAKDFAYECLAMVTSRAAWAIGLDSYGIEPGCRADFSLVQSPSVRQAISDQPVRSWVFFHGEPILHQQLSQQWLQLDNSRLSAV